jgi:hypothetical protein
MDENKGTKRIRFQLLVRLVSRCAEVAARPEMTDEGKWVYGTLFAPAADAFCKSHDAMADAESTVGALRLEVERMASKVDPLYCTVRLIVLAVLPAQKLPDTLKAQPTDTDMLNAVTTMLSVVKSHADKDWAVAVMTGQFGTLAPQLEAALKQLIAATHALETARLQRLAAYGPAYKGYLTFKRVVRNTLGSSSCAYRRLHPRKTASTEPAEPAETDAEDQAPDSTVQPTSKAPAAPAAGPSSVKVA